MRVLKHLGKGFTLLETLIVMGLISLILMLTASVINTTYREFNETFFISSLTRMLHQAQLSAVVSHSQRVVFIRSKKAYCWPTDRYETLALPVPNEFVRYSNGARLYYRAKSGYIKIQRLRYITPTHIYIFQYELGSGHFKCIKKEK